MHQHIRRYEFRRNDEGLRLILWAPLERGGRTVVAVTQKGPGASVEHCMLDPQIQAAIPDRLLRVKI